MVKAEYSKNSPKRVLATEQNPSGIFQILEGMKNHSWWIYWVLFPLGSEQGLGNDKSAQDSTPTFKSAMGSLWLLEEY